MLTQTGKVTGVKIPTQHCCPTVYWSEERPLRSELLPSTDVRNNWISATLHGSTLSVVPVLCLYFAHIPVHSFIYMLNRKGHMYLCLDSENALNNNMSGRGRCFTSRQYLENISSVEGFEFSYLQTWLCFRIKNVSCVLGISGLLSIKQLNLPFLK